ncbi:MAG: hypothetical protein AABW81_00510 [Nanoarchaeota archaeon]
MLDNNIHKEYLEDYKLKSGDFIPILGVIKYLKRTHKKNTENINLVNIKCNNSITLLTYNIFLSLFIDISIKNNLLEKIIERF